MARKRRLGVEMLVIVRDMAYDVSHYRDSLDQGK